MTAHPLFVQLLEWPVFARLLGILCTINRFRVAIVDRLSVSEGIGMVIVPFLRHPRETSPL